MSEPLPVDPRTGVSAIAVLPSGRIVWPMAGGDGTGDPPAGDPPAGDPPTPPTGTPPTPPDTGDKTDWKAEAEKWKVLARKHENQAKANAGAADTAKTLEERLAALETARTDAEARALRAEVAQAKGLTAAQGKYLSGATREEMEAAADELKTAFKPSDTPDLRNRRPTEALRPGTVPDAKPEETDPAKLAAKVPRG